MNIYRKLCICVVLCLGLCASVVISIPPAITTKCKASCSCGCRSGLPCVCIADSPMFGVEEGKLDNGPTYRFNGKKVTRDDVIEQLKNRLVDDSVMLRLTVVGSVADRKKVLDDMESVSKGKALIQSYNPNDPVIITRGFDNLMGKPDVFLQKADGTLLVHLRDWSPGGRDQLIKVMNNPDTKPLRPQPQPKPDDPKPCPPDQPCPKPDEPFPLPKPPIDLPKGVTPTMFWVGVGVLLLLIFRKEK